MNSFFITGETMERRLVGENALTVYFDDRKGTFQVIEYNEATPIHTHEDFDEELLFEGEAMAVVGEEERRVQSGDLIRVPMGVRHGVKPLGKVKAISVHRPPPWNGLAFNLKRKRDGWTEPIGWEGKGHPFDAYGLLGFTSYREAVLSNGSALNFPGTVKTQEVLVSCLEGRGEVALEEGDGVTETTLQPYDFLGMRTGKGFVLKGVSETIFHVAVINTPVEEASSGYPPLVSRYSPSREVLRGSRADSCSRYVYTAVDENSPLTTVCSAGVTRAEWPGGISSWDKGKGGHMHEQVEVYAPFEVDRPETQFIYTRDETVAIPLKPGDSPVIVIPPMHFHATNAGKYAWYILRGCCPVKSVKARFETE